MAELIEEIISQAAFKQVEQMKLDLKALQKQFEDLIKVTGQPIFGQGGGNGNAVKGQLDELDKVKRQITQTQDRLTAMSTAYGQALVDERQKLAELNKELKDNTRANAAAAGSLDEMQLKLKRAQEEYRKLSETIRNSDVGKKLLTDIQAQNAAVSALEQSMGKFQRNVGNYASATMSLSQVFREIPAFTYSAQTGILALSNNLPILVDQFKATAAQTGSAAAALKIFGASIFSLTNIFTIAFGLFAIFSKQIFEFISGTKEADKATKDLAKSIGQESAELKLLTSVVNNMNISMDKRTKAAEKLIELYPQTLKNYTAEQIAMGKANKELQMLTQSVIAYAKVKAIQTQIEELAAQQWETQGKITLQSRTELELRYERDRINNRLKLLKPGTNAYDIEIDKLNSINNEIGQSRSLMNEYTNQVKSAENAMQSLAMKAADLLPDMLSEDAPDKPLKDKKTKDAFKLIPPDLTPTQAELDDIDKYYQRMEAEALKILGQYKDNPETEEAFKQAFLSIPNKGELSAEEAADLNNLLLNRARMIKENSKKTTDANLEIWREHFGNVIALGQTISDIAYQKEIAQIESRQRKLNEYYDAEKQRINSSFTSQRDKEKELAKLEAQRAAQQKRIDQDKRAAARKQAQQQKAIDIASIVTATALAVIKAYTEGDPYTKIPRALAAAAAGAISLARAASAPIPEFAKGTDNAPEGYAKVSEKGHELVIEPSGKSWVTPAKETITYLKKGSKVIPNDKLMKMVESSAYQQLAVMGTPVTSELYGKALVNQFEALTEDVRDLKAIMANKDMRVNVIGNYDHYMHVRKNIR